MDQAVPERLDQRDKQGPDYEEPLSCVKEFVLYFRENLSILSLEKINLKGDTDCTVQTSSERVTTGRQGFPGGAVGQNLPANAWGMGSSPGPGRCHTLWSN